MIELAGTLRCKFFQFRQLAVESVTANPESGRGVCSYLPPTEKCAENETLIDATDTSAAKSMTIF